MLLNYKYWLIPLIIYLAIIPFTPYLDITISGLFYHNGFIYKDYSYFNFLLKYGEIPALLSAALAFVIFLLSFFFKPLRSLRETCLFITLTLVVGAGLITNAILKDHWGRPRPRQTTIFGGNQPFKAMYQPDFHNPNGASFNSGHAAMGFFFLSFIIAGWRRHSRFFVIAGIILTLFMGLSLSLTRIVQGGHFFSDVLTSAIVMWLTAVLINWLIPEQNYD